jgi:tetratricopeptide (TPR) repeat protein
MNDRDALARRFHEGLCLEAGGDHDRAGTSFLECVLAEPGCFEFVREFVANLRMKVAAGKQPASLPPGDLAGAVHKATAEANWAEVLRLGPRLLTNHSSHVPTLMALAGACEAQGHSKAAACYLTAAVQTAGDDDEILRRAGQAFARLREYDQAIDCWRQVEPHDPYDEEAPRAITTLTIARNRQRAGVQGADELPSPAPNNSAQPYQDQVTRFVIGNVDALVQSAAPPGGMSLTPIQQLEAAIRERPSIPELYLRLAQIYLDRDRDYDAERLLAKGREATDRDARVQQMWEEVTILRHARRVAIAQQELQAADNPQTRDALKQATKERDRIELEIFLGRCKREPENAASQYALGLRLMRAEKPREARRHFEKALPDAGQRGPAALALGQCLEELGELPEALRFYRLAAESGSSADQEDVKKESLYRAAKLALRIKLARLAQRYLAELIRIDPNHRKAAVLMQST